MSQTTGYAIEALTCMAHEACRPGSIQRISACTGVPRAYLAKLAKKLATAGLITAKRGYRGGLRLAREPEQISLLQISAAVDGPEFFQGCLLGHAQCSEERACPAHRFWKAARAEITAQLSAITLADAVAFAQRNGQQRDGRTSRRKAA
jgi:Rrf2 family protein